MGGVAVMIKLRWMWENMPITLIGFVLLPLLVAILVWGNHRHNMRRDAFIAECIADGKKHYECDTMWRVGRWVQ